MRSSRRERGDWQTPRALADEALAVVARGGFLPRVVLEPTCGEGAFLAAAAKRFPRAALLGFEIDREHARAAEIALDDARARATITVADFFHVAWEERLASLPEPILITGNPPWVTSAVLGALGSSNLPGKTNFKSLTGLDARTGKSNFDVSEWMLLRLIEALRGKRATLAVLCKTAVARRVIEHTTRARRPVTPGALYTIDAPRHFGAAVDAVLFVCEIGAPEARDASAPWPIHDALGAVRAASHMKVSDGVLVADARRLARTAHVQGTCEPEWRSGIKHDCARVFEVTRRDRAWINGFGERVVVEEEHVFPLLKSSDVVNEARDLRRAMLVTQRALGEDTRRLAKSAPRLHRYLTSHREILRARKSSIYRGQPDFAMFGVGPYSFAPWKVAVSGLYKRWEVALLGPRDDKPVVLDDTCYFLAFASERRARRAWEALRSPLARDFFGARIFWDAKRPIVKGILQQIDLDALITATSSRPLASKAP